MSPQADEKRLTTLVDIQHVLTPEIIAAAFIRMNSRKQAEVFHEIQRQAESLFNAQLQWCYLSQDLREAGPESPGWRFAVDIGAFTMVHTYRLLEGCEGRTV